MVPSLCGTAPAPLNTRRHTEADESQRGAGSPSGTDSFWVLCVNRKTDGHAAKWVPPPLALVVATWGHRSWMSYVFLVGSHSAKLLWNFKIHWKQAEWIIQVGYRDAWSQLRMCFCELITHWPQKKWEAYLVVGKCCPQTKAQWDMDFSFSRKSYDAVSLCLYYNVAEQQQSGSGGWGMPLLQKHGLYSRTTSHHGSPWTGQQRHGPVWGVLKLSIWNNGLSTATLELKTKLILTGKRSEFSYSAFFLHFQKEMIRLFSVFVTETSIWSKSWKQQTNCWPRYFLQSSCYNHAETEHRMWLVLLSPRLVWCIQDLDYIKEQS